MCPSRHPKHMLGKRKADFQHELELEEPCLHQQKDLWELLPCIAFQHEPDGPGMRWKPHSSTELTCSLPACGTEVWCGAHQSLLEASFPTS